MMGTVAIAELLQRLSEFGITGEEAAEALWLSERSSQWADFPSHLAGGPPTRPAPSRVPFQRPSPSGWPAAGGPAKRPLGRTSQRPRALPGPSRSPGRA